MEKKLITNICGHCGNSIISQDGKTWVHGTISGGGIFEAVSLCEKPEPDPRMKFAVIINDNSMANLVMAFSPTEAIEKTMQHCTINRIMVNKVIVYHLVEL